MTAQEFFQLANSVLHYTLITVNDTPITLASLRTFRKRGVEIPFPQRDLHFRTPFPQSKTSETVSL